MLGLCYAQGPRALSNVYHSQIFYNTFEIGVARCAHFQFHGVSESFFMRSVSSSGVICVVPHFVTLTPAAILAIVTA